MLHGRHGYFVRLPMSEEGKRLEQREQMTDLENLLHLRPTYLHFVIPSEVEEFSGIHG
jgi:hypothetical protein